METGESLVVCGTHCSCTPMYTFWFHCFDNQTSFHEKPRGARINTVSNPSFLQPNSPLLGPKLDWTMHRVFNQPPPLIRPPLMTRLYFSNLSSWEFSAQNRVNVAGSCLEVKIKWTTMLTTDLDMISARLITDHDSCSGSWRYQIFHRLLNFFHRGRRKRGKKCYDSILSKRYLVRERSQL